MSSRHSRKMKRKNGKASDAAAVRALQEYQERITPFADIEVKIVGGSVFIYTRSKLKNDTDGNSGGSHGTN